MNYDPNGHMNTPLVYNSATGEYFHPEDLPQAREIREELRKCEGGYLENNGQTPWNPVLFSEDGEYGFGRNIIQPYKEDSFLEKIGKGFVNYVFGTIINIFDAPNQALLNTTAATRDIILGNDLEFKQRSFTQEVLPPSVYKTVMENQILRYVVPFALDSVSSPTNIMGGVAVNNLSKLGKIDTSVSRSSAGVDEVGKLSTNKIHFMQSSIKNTTGEYTVLGNAEALKAGTLKPTDLPTIKVWKDAQGKTWTLDHRRLAALRLGGVKKIPVEWASKSLVESQMWKMTTKTGGTTIKLKIGNGEYIIIK